MIETQYLVFSRELEEEKGTTQVWAVASQRHGYTLGMIRWYGAWRQYVFLPSGETLFNVQCMTEIRDFVTRLMDERKAVRKDARP